MTLHPLASSASLLREIDNEGKNRVLRSRPPVDECTEVLSSLDTQFTLLKWNIKPYVYHITKQAPTMHYTHIIHIQSHNASKSCWNNRIYEMSPRERHTNVQITIWKLSEHQIYKFACANQRKLSWKWKLIVIGQTHFHRE